MDNLISLFESENILLKDNMQTALGRLLISSDQIKSIYKSLLLVHISKIEELEERLLWQELISKLDGFDSQDLTLLSFGPLENSSSFKNPIEINEKTYEIPIRKDKYGFDNKKIKHQNTGEILDEKKAKALENAMKVGLKLKIMDCFRIWYGSNKKLDRVSKEYYWKKLKGKAMTCWKKCGYFLKIQNAKYKKAYKHYNKKAKLFIMMKWAKYIRDRYREKIEYYVSGGDNSRARRFNYEKVAYKEYRKPFKNHKKGSHKVQFLYKTTENNQKSFMKIIKNNPNPKVTFHNTTKRSEMLKTFKKSRSSKNCPTKNYIFLAWKTLTKYKRLCKITHSLIWKNLASWGFRAIRLWVMKRNSYKNKRDKNSIDYLTDYELSMKIEYLEKKLVNMQYLMLDEKITNISLISEKEEILKSYV